MFSEYESDARQLLMPSADMTPEQLREASELLDQMAVECRTLPKAERAAAETTLENLRRIHKEQTERTALVGGAVGVKSSASDRRRLEDSGKVLHL